MSRSTSVPFALTPTPDERLPHFLARLAAHNHYPSSQWLLELINQSASVEHEVSNLNQLCAKPGLAGPIACVTGLDESTIGQMLTPEVGGGGRWRMVHFGNHQLPGTAILHGQVRYCPVCVAEGLPDWRPFSIAFMTACPVHHRQLDLRCSHPRCTSMVCWDQHVGGMDTASLESQAAEQPERELTHEIATLHAGGDARAGAPYRSLSELLELLLAFSWISVPESSLGRYEFSLNAESMVVLRARSALAWSFIRSRSDFHQALQAWISPRQRAWPSLPTRAYHLNIWEAIQSLESPSLRSALSEWLDSYQPSEHQTLYPDCSAAHGAQATVAQAAWILQLSETLIRALAKGGHFALRPAFPGRKQSDMVIAMADLDCLCRRLHAVAGARDASHAFRPLSFRWPGSKGSGHLSVPEVINQVLTQQRAIAWPHGGTMASLMVGPIRECVQREDPGYSVAAVATRLGIYSDAIYRLMRTGLLVPDVRSSLKSARFSQDVIDSFSARYVFVKEVASRLGVNHTNLADRLRSLGIEPVSGPGIDSGLIYLFRRSDLDGIDAKLLAPQVPYRSTAGRKPKSSTVEETATLRSAQVSQRIGVSVQNLRHLERGGTLMPMNRRSPRKRYSLEAVDRFLGEYDQNPDLMCADDAAAAMRLKRGVFIKRYLNSGLIPHRTDGFRLFVNRAEAELHVFDAADWVPVFRACELAGISMSRMRYLIRCGVVSTRHASPQVSALLVNRHSLPMQTKGETLVLSQPHLSPSRGESGSGEESTRLDI